MKNHFKIIALLSLQTVNISSFSDKDVNNFGYDVGKVFITQICSVLIPDLINNPPQSNFKEYFRSIFFNENSLINAEIEELNKQLSAVKLDIKST